MTSLSPSIQLQLQVWRQHYQKWQKLWRDKWYLIVLGVLFVAGALIVAVPAWRSLVLVKVAPVQALLGQDQGKQLPVEDQRVVQLEEVVADLEKRLSAAEAQNGDRAKQLAGLGDQVKLAITEVSKENDQWVKQQQTWVAAAKAAGVQVAGEETGATTPAGTSTKVNLNTATVSQLDGLPGIGPTYAQKIITYREEKGLFKKVEDIQNVSGIGPATFAKIKDMIEV